MLQVKTNRGSASNYLARGLGQTKYAQVSYFQFIWNNNERIVLNAICRIGISEDFFIVISIRKKN